LDEKMSDVVFRRINGRIVPIKVKKVAKGSAELAGGAAVGVGTGIAAAKLVKKSSELTKQSRVKYRVASQMFDHFTGQMNLFDKPDIHKAQQTMKTATKIRYAGMKAFKLRNNLLLGGAAVSGVLIASGFKRIREAMGGKKIKDEKVSKVAGTVAALGVYATYYHNLPLGSIAKVAVNTAARFRGKPRPFQASWF
jgi:hypothetical protein